jgi:ABC-type phosphate transport system substrate-binding protein
MRFNWRKASVVLAAGLSGALALSGVAGASTSIPGSGQDNKNDVAIGQGSDTTYVVTNDLFQMYNQSPGCKTDIVTGSGTLGQCLPTPTGGATQDAPQDNAGDNWDHDVIVGQYPTGSGAGIRALILNQVSFARSSSAPTSGASPSQAGLNFFAFAKDGIVVTTGPGRATLSLTTAQLKSIYNCSVTTWGGLLGTADTTPIAAYGMQTSSGTYNTMKAYLGFDPDLGACVKHLADGTFPFENNVQPVLADATAQGFGPANIIWWGSFGELKTYAYKDAGANFSILDGQVVGNGTISSNAYPITRFLFHVVPKTTADPSAAGSSDLVGATTGAPGAVRQFTQWLCKERAWFIAGSTAAPTNAALNPYTGTYYYDDITNTIAASGFQRTPAAARTNGACGIQVATS